MPAHLIVLGGGVVGCEMAQTFRTLGSEVTIIEPGDHLLGREEPFVSDALRTAFDAIGITVHTGASADRVHRDDAGGPIEVHLGDGAIISGDELLVATGRRPATRDLGVDTVGLTAGDAISVDDFMVATGLDGDWLYAVGDVNGRSPLTHTGKYQARTAGDHIAARGPGDRPPPAPAYGDKLAEPRVIFTNPHVAAVGITAPTARERDIDVRTVSFDIGDTAGASTFGRGVTGTCHLVVDEKRRVIVGATFIGPGVGEMLHAATIAIVGEVTIDTLWHAIPAFPTMSEVWLRLLEAYGL